MSVPANKLMYLHRMGNLVRIQSFHNGKAAPQMLTIELASGIVSLSDSSKPLNQETGAEKILGVFGLQKLPHGFALAVITGVKQVEFSLPYPSDTESSMYVDFEIYFILT